MSFDLLIVQNQDLAVIENMIPWERDLFVDQLRQHIEEQNMQVLQSRASNGRRY